MDAPIVRGTCAFLCSRVLIVGQKLRSVYCLPMTGEGALYGVDITTGGIADSFANFVWEPAVVKVSSAFFHL